jgi:AraC family transcriptional regulator
MGPRALRSDDDALVGVQLTEAVSKSLAGIACIFSAGGLTAQHVRVNTPNGFTVNWQGHPYYVALHDLHNTDCEIFADEHPAARQRDLRGRLAFIPSDCRAWGWMVPNSKAQSFTALFMDPAGLDQEFVGRLQRWPQRARVYFHDEKLRSTLTKLRTCLEADISPDRMYAESLCMVAAMELCQLPAETEDATDMLGRQFTDRVVDYIEQNLGRDLSLADLSMVAGLSRFHFLRSFRRATRETPYQYLLRRRIERARELLRAGDLSVAEIGLAVGFKNSTRFAVVFRKMMNCTPSAFRASMRR